MGILEETYSRISYALVSTLASIYWKKLVGQVNNWPTLLLIIFGTIFSLFLDIKIKGLPRGKCNAVKTGLSMMLSLVNTLLAFFLSISIVGMFEDDETNEVTLDSIYKPILFMATLAVLLSLLNIFSYFEQPTKTIE